MVKKQMSSSIVRLLKWTVPALLVGILSVCLGRSLLSHSDLFKDINAFFMQFKGLFFIWHWVFYAVIYVAWPSFVLLLSRRQQTTPNPIQINQAIHARVYLVLVLLVFELLHGVR